jgi:hydroxymethylpyrimidine/phosphomethylpyrimidine kinase
VIPNVLSIAGTDPSGGAGIQADIKAISANGGYAMAVVSALVAQTTTGVTASFEVPAAFVREQIDTLCADVRVDAVKIGLLPSAEIVEAVADALDRWDLRTVVVDPVLVAKSGQALSGPSALDAVRRYLLPRAGLVTPNIPEAAAILEEAPAADLATMAGQAHRLLAFGPGAVLLKGGHLPGPSCTDVLVDGTGVTDQMGAPRVRTRNDHGTGCTLSSAIATLRPQRQTWALAVAGAKQYLTGALQAAGSLQVGTGHGPVHHFWALWPAAGAGPALSAQAGGRRRPDRH